MLAEDAVEEERHRDLLTLRLIGARTSMGGGPSSALTALVGVAWRTVRRARG